MISKPLQKLIRSLEQKKYRKESGLFVGEGSKLVGDLLDTFECDTLIASPQWIETHRPTARRVVETTPDEIRKASLMTNQQEAIALFRQKQYTLNPYQLCQQLTLALDTVQDPGNLGTIIRLADWFGIGDIVCSPNCADLYNPKTVQATMGSLNRVRIHYTSLDSLFRQLDDTPIYGTFLDGDNIYDKPLIPNGILLMGNEGNGISPLLEQFVTRRLYIPPYPINSPTGESLNVAIATAIVCAEFRRGMT